MVECLQCMVLTNLVLQVESLRAVLSDFIDYILVNRICVEPDS